MDSKIEDKWMESWEKLHVFESDPDASREKKFLTFPFPYMNGPLHIGHAFTSVRVDVYARYKRMQGYDVLFPWAWHWTGQPIVAAAERLANGDEAMIREFVSIDGISPKDLPKFYDPKYMAQHYTDSGRLALKRLALSIDWRREFHTTDLEPAFNKFVVWQYNKLREKGYVTMGTHPVVWCPRDQSPTGDHDRVQGEGVTWEEYTLVLFKLSDEDIFLPAATFRPETIFGVTNLWVNPDSSYSEISLGGKTRWIVSSDAVLKLKEQMKDIVVVNQIWGRQLVGKHVVNPINEKVSLPIFPATFVDPKNGSGIVYSVPAHAPLDYVALRDLQSNVEVRRKFLLNEEEVEGIKPISLVEVKGMDKFPAKQVVEDLKVRDQNDPSISAATAEVYKKEFHQGILNEITGEFSGRKVSEAKPLITEKMRQSGLASSMYDLPEKVICRCLTECIVKVLEDQWFLKYSDQKWKLLAHQCVSEAVIYPESSRQWFHDVIDWIRDWPCARKVGLGTPLPWSPGWIVETLSDSTIYMAFYTIRHVLVALGVDGDKLTDGFFSYVFLGEGEAEFVGEAVGIDTDVLTRMRAEFLYWYPVNLRNSAKELIPNHLLFFIFQHTAFFPPELWPKGISANGMMTVEGEKMSKSKGNVITISSALQIYGADTLRSALMDGAEGLEDIDWRDKNARDIQSKINSLPAYMKNFESSGSLSENMTLIDYWLESRIQKHIENVAAYLDSMKTKSAFQEAFYSYWNDLRMYSTHRGKGPKELVVYAINTWVKLLAPFVPYTAEEINASFGGKQIVCNSEFPKRQESRAHPDAELGITLVENLVEDARKILRLITNGTNVLHLYCAQEWQNEMFSDIVGAREVGTKTNELLRQFFEKHPNVDRKESAAAFNRISRIVNELGDTFLDNFKDAKDVNEASIYSGAHDYLERQLSLRVIIHTPNDADVYDPKNKAKFAIPFKPALYIE